MNLRAPCAAVAAFFGCWLVPSSCLECANCSEDLWRRPLPWGGFDEAEQLGNSWGCAHHTCLPAAGPSGTLCVVIMGRTDPKQAKMHFDTQKTARAPADNEDQSGAESLRMDEMAG
ncbi:hypothetical protein NDU88_005985 [Pleurodeles waltl]|uniref:Secreted protein n=1 Tax=Pleurodeles waltl TaxID=8319 RepID=A0AAV7RKB4_PLEWA|nr:hypothetical protein NDU88_005985 [Pleurodeles waltl]